MSATSSACPTIRSSRSAGKSRFEERPNAKPYGFFAHVSEEHLTFEVTTGPLLFGGVTGGFGRGPVACPSAAGLAVGVTPGEAGLATLTTGFGGVGGGVRMVAPPITGAGFATPPILFSWLLARP